MAEQCIFWTSTKHVGQCLNTNLTNKIYWHACTLDNNEIVGHKDWSGETKLYIGYVESRKAMIDSFGETLSVRPPQ